MKQEEKPKGSDAPPPKNDKKVDPKLAFVLEVSPMQVTVRVLAMRPPCENASLPLQEFKRTGMNASQARKVLSTWEKAGVKDPEQLRKLLMQRTLPSLTGPLVQALVDSVICFGGKAA